MHPFRQSSTRSQPARSGFRRLRASSAAFLAVTSVIGLGIVPPCATRASTYTWDGNGNGNIDSGGNWIGGTPPSEDSSAQVVFSSSGTTINSTYNANLDVNFYVNSLTYAGNSHFTLGSSNNKGLDIGNGGLNQNSTVTQSITVPTFLTADQTWTFASGAGALTFSGNGSVNLQSYTLTVAAQGSNTLNANLSGTGSLAVDGGGGTLTLTGTVSVPYEYIGNNSATPATFSQTGGNNAVTNTLYLGYDSTSSSGTYNLGGTGSTLSAVNERIGNSGTGTFNQTGGSNTVSTALYLGNSGGSGTYNLGGAGSTLSAASEYIGNSTSGTFNQTGGTNTVSGTLHLGETTSSVNGNVTTYYIGIGTYNLNGGVLQPASVTSGSLTAGTFNFNGGTLQAGASSTSFFQGVAMANVQAGGAFIDTQAYNVTVAQSLVHDRTSGAPATDGGLTKLGTGTLTLTGASAYTGTTTVTAGTLALASGSLTGGSLYVGNGGPGTFTQSGGTNTVNGSVTLGGSVASSSGGITIYNPVTGTYNLNGGVLQAASVTTNGFGYSIFDFNGGTLRAGASSTSFFQGLTTANVQAGGASIDTNVFNVTVAQNLLHDTTSGAPATDGGLTKLGTGTLTLTGANTYTGTTTFAGGALNVGSSGALGSSGTLSFTAGTLQYSASNTTDYSARFSTAANQAYSIDTNGQNITFATGLTSSGGGLSKLGAGTLTLTGANTYTGITMVVGTLALGNGGSLTGSGLYVGEGGTGTYTQSGGSLTGSLLLIGDGGTGTLTQSGGSFTISGDSYVGYTAAPGSYTLSGTGSLSTGNVYVGHGNTGTFTQSGGSFTTNSHVLTLGSELGGSGSYTLSGTGSLSTGNVYVGDSNTGTFTQSGGSFTTLGNAFVGSDFGTGTYTQSGGSFTTTGNTLTLGYSGGTGTYILNGGTLTVGALTTDTDHPSGTGTFNFNGGTLQASASTTSFFQGVTTANVQAGGAFIDTQAYNITVAQALLHDTTSGAPAQDGGLTKLGSGTLTLTGTNTYTGPTNVNAGTLLVNGTSSGTGTVTVQNSGSVLGGTGTISAAVNVTTGALNPGNNAGANGSAANVGKLTVGALTLSSTATSIFDLNSSTTYDQVQANGNVTLAGTLTLDLPAQPTFTTNQVLDLVHANGGLLTGTFSNVANLGTYTYSGESFLATYTATDFELTAINAVPEPATWLGGALLLAAAGEVLRRRARA